MSATLDTLLVVAAVLLAAAYLIHRKIRSARKLDRDWNSGRAESCDHCPVIEIRKQQHRRSASS